VLEKVGWLLQEGMTETLAAADTVAGGLTVAL
jgi:hypothetical protein